MADDVVLNKTSIIERCLQRVREEYEDDPSNLHDDITNFTQFTERVLATDGFRSGT